VCRESRQCDVRVNTLLHHGEYVAVADADALKSDSRFHSKHSSKY